MVSPKPFKIKEFLYQFISLAIFKIKEKENPFK